MAALEDPVESRLKTMDETMYVSKNRELKEIARTMDTVEPNTALLGMIQHNAWHALDEYFRGMPGTTNFLSNLQQLFIFKYRLGNITRKQFQIAMGIQQMIWMSDTENCLLKKLVCLLVHSHFGNIYQMKKEF